jgi:hypothetical protein
MNYRKLRPSFLSLQLFFICFPAKYVYKLNSAIFPLLLAKMIAVPLSKVRRFCDLFSARFEQNSGEHRYLATLYFTSPYKGRHKLMKAVLTAHKRTRQPQADLLAQFTTSVYDHCLSGMPAPTDFKNAYMS